MFVYEIESHFTSVGSRCVVCCMSTCILVSSWICSFSLSLLYITRRLDYVVELAENLGMHLLMCTESYNFFCQESSNCNTVVGCFKLHKYFSV